MTFNCSILLVWFCGAHKWTSKRHINTHERAIFVKNKCKRTLFFCNFGGRHWRPFKNLVSIWTAVTFIGPIFDGQQYQKGLHVCECVRTAKTHYLQAVWQIITLTIIFFCVRPSAGRNNSKNGNLCTHLFGRPTLSISGFLVNPAYLLLSNDLTEPIIHRTIFYMRP